VIAQPQHRRHRITHATDLGVDICTRRVPGVCGVPSMSRKLGILIPSLRVFTDALRRSDRYARKQREPHAEQGEAVSDSVHAPPWRAGRDRIGSDHIDHANTLLAAPASLNHCSDVAACV
jgi:hypothetical protein